MHDPFDIIGLASIISESVASLTNVCTTNNFRIPRLDEGFDRESEAFRLNEDASKLTSVIAAAAFRLAATLLPPEETVFQNVTGDMKSAALRVAISCHVPEILRDAGSQGVHSSIIAQKSGVDGMKLARLLRYLANRYIFREVAPDVFTNNGISSVLDTGKSIDEILHDPESKYDGTNGLAALAEHYLSEGHKSSAYLLENMKDPKTSHSTEVNQAPLQRGLGTNMTYWEWLSQPEQLYQRRRFGVSAKGNAKLAPSNYIVNAFDWKSLPTDHPIVDVGGGVGTSAIAIIKAFPELCAVVQDLPTTTSQAIEICKTELPIAFDSQRLKVQAHDFFTPQPIKNASVFLLKFILHDWPDPQAVEILRHLREAAMPSTRLIVLDAVIPYTCDNSNLGSTEFGAESGGIPGLSLGATNEMPFSNDIAMMIWLNSQERTLGQLRKLFELSGWRLVRATQNRRLLDYVEALPS